ncbi:complex I subunit 4 family protein [Pseudochryseolinea flava]|uniref:NADH-quinone oxidoreductase subunit M n=1 Tax=Pseudochryseolinea flava TaxID=2059302 RepID=A0A364XZX6_9BACT|nr:NADH-quinone oxidoreductase subunit M [Pseudochryseolinea flava]RAV99038.1 NADH-quinone oxidoreductase subunit M [Pseudochryseolinea flava]
MLTVFLIFFPLLISVLLLVLKPAHAKVWALAASIIELAASLFVAYSFDKNGGLQYFVNVPWIDSLGLSFYVAIDGISLLLVLLTTVLVPFIILSSFGHQYEKPSTFYGLILMMQMALVGVFTARDGLLFYLFWEAALIPIYFICLIWGGAERGRITLKFFIYTLAGSLFMLVALVYLYFLTPGEHTFNIYALYDAGAALGPYPQALIFWAMFVAFAIKMPVFPFHTWQPDTYTNAPTQGTMLLSGIMLKMGIYGVIRWLLPLVPLGVKEWGLTAVIISVIGIIYASCIAIVQKDLKRLIAYSSIAHVGLISAGIFTLSETGIQGAMIQMISHGILVVALFFIVDIIQRRTQTSELIKLGGIRNAAPIFTTVFIIVMLGSVALPSTSGFVGEFLLINSLVQYKFALGIVAGLTIILGAVYMLRSFQQSMSGEANAITATFTDLTGHEKLVLYPIVLMIIVIGVYPAPLLDISESAVKNIVEIYSNYSASVK